MFVTVVGEAIDVKPVRNSQLIIADTSFFNIYIYIYIPAHASIIVESVI